jgi:peptide/nickel transport system substrate-binding protein
MKTLKAALILGATMLAAGPVLANDEKPRYGGSVEIGTVYVTLSALSWDANDFNWKHNHDTGLVYEQLFAADLSKSVKAGGKHPFVADAWHHVAREARRHEEPRVRGRRRAVRLHAAR